MRKLVYRHGPPHHRRHCQWRKRVEGKRDQDRGSISEERAQHPPTGEASQELQDNDLHRSGGPIKCADFADDLCKNEGERHEMALVDAEIPFNGVVISRDVREKQEVVYKEPTVTHQPTSERNLRGDQGDRSDRDFSTG